MRGDCRTCGFWSLDLESHRCPPRWEVRDADDCDDSDWRTVHEIDDEDAARRYAKDLDSRSGDGPCERTVLVREVGSSEVKRYAITFDYSVDYFVHKERP